MKPGELLGEGRTAQVFAWTPGHVVKLYYPWWPERNIEYEARIGRAVHAAGVEAPNVGPTVEVNGRKGLVYERVDGPSMLQALEKNPRELDHMAALFARLHAAMHGAHPQGLPDQRERLKRQIEAAAPSPLPTTLKEKALSALDRLPGGTALCHGDFHPGNVLMSATGPRSIDWENAALGSPLADAARTLLLLEGAQATTTDPREKDWISRFGQLYLAEYASLTGADPAVIRAWRGPLAAARLSEGVAEEESFLLSVVEEQTGQGA